MSAPDIPTNYTVTSAVTIDSLDAGLDNIRIKEIGPVGLTRSAFPKFESYHAALSSL